MARYYFHARSKHYALLDEKGKVLDGAWEARTHARMLIQKWQHDLCFRNDEDSWVIEICDGSGFTELVVGFPDHSHLVEALAKEDPRRTPKRHYSVPHFQKRRAYVKYCADRTKSDDI